MCQWSQTVGNSTWDRTIFTGTVQRFSGIEGFMILNLCFALQVCTVPCFALFCRACFVLLCGALLGCALLCFVALCFDLLAVHALNRQSAKAGVSILSVMDVRPLGCRLSDYDRSISI